MDFYVIFDADKDWIGNSHLNEFGAIKFTKELINIIKTNGNQAALSIIFSKNI